MLIMHLPDEAMVGTQSVRSKLNATAGTELPPPGTHWNRKLEWVRPVIVFHVEIAVKRKAKTCITNRENMRALR